jgi:hypothetical protein
MGLLAVGASDEIERLPHAFLGVSTWYPLPSIAFCGVRHDATPSGTGGRMIPRWHLVDHPESSPALRPTLGAAETAPGPQGLPHFKHEARLDCNHDVMM